MYNVSYIKDIGTATVGNTQAAGKVLCQFFRYIHGKEEQRFARHVHFLARKLFVFDVHREGIGQLDAEQESCIFSQFLQALQHRYGIIISQVILEMTVRKSHVAISQLIDGLPDEIISQESRIAFDKGIEMLFCQEIRRNPFDFFRRTAVHGRNGHGIADSSRDGPYVFFCQVLEQVRMAQEPVPAFPEDVRPGCILQSLNEPIDFRTADAFQIISDRHIELESIHGTEAVLFGQDMEEEPGLDVFFKGLGNSQLRRPFDVITFIIGMEARFGYRQVFPIESLHSLEFKETGACRIGCGDILGQLCVWPGSRSKGRFQFSSKYRVCTGRVGLI